MLAVGLSQMHCIRLRKVLFLPILLRAFPFFRSGILKIRMSDFVKCFLWIYYYDYIIFFFYLWIVSYTGWFFNVELILHFQDRSAYSWCTPFYIVRFVLLKICLSKICLECLHLTSWQIWVYSVLIMETWRYKKE